MSLTYGTAQDKGETSELIRAHCYKHNNITNLERMTFWNEVFTSELNIYRDMRQGTRSELKCYDMGNMGYGEVSNKKMFSFCVQHLDL